MLRPLVITLAVFAASVAPAWAGSIEAVLDAMGTTTLVGPAGIPAIRAAMACSASGCAACPAGPSAAASLRFDRDNALSHSAWQRFQMRVAQSDRAAADAVAKAYSLGFDFDASQDGAFMKAVGLHADDLADQAAAYWLTLRDIATNPVAPPQASGILNLPDTVQWVSRDGAPLVVKTRAQLLSLAARLRAVLRCDPAVAKLTPRERSDLGYALQIATHVVRGLYTATHEQSAREERAVVEAVEKAVAAKGLDLRHVTFPIAP